MTTCIIDLKHKVVVTDGRLTSTTISGTRPLWLIRAMAFQNIWERKTEYIDNYFNKFYRIPSHGGQTIFSCACGDVSEIKSFLKQFQKNKLPTKFLLNSTVFLMKYVGQELRVYRAHNSIISSIGDRDTSWIVMGSGKDVATGAIMTLSVEDKNRAVKAIQAASDYDIGTSFDTRVYRLEEFDDIY